MSNTIEISATINHSKIIFNRFVIILQLYIWHDFTKSENHIDIAFCHTYLSLTHFKGFFNIMAFVYIPHVMNESENK